ncbi:MAG: DUF362 domain-containing protein [Opitutales bacterium]|nr:DUF362 domain-containing protein [Opitutales bacterium]
MKRREFVKTAVAATAAAAVAKPLMAAVPAGKPLDLVAVYGGEPVEMFRKGIAAMGGMSRFVKKGQTVVVKPNIGWDRKPEFGSNANPELVGEIVKQCFKFGAKEVLCFDHTCHRPEDCYKNSGIAEAVKAAGGTMVDGNSSNMYIDQDLPKGVSLKKAKVHKLAANADVFINVPVLKHHGGAKITCAMKNYMGCVEDRQFWHRNDLPQCIADFSTYQKTTLTVVDAYRVMLEHGPQGKDPKFAPVAKYQVISTDIVAADAAAIGIFATVAKQYGMGKPYTVDEIPYVGLAEKLGVGTADLSKLNVKKISMA